MVTFRPLQETDRRTLREILQYAFDPASGPTVDASSASDTGAEWPPELYEPYGLYADDGVDDSVSAADSDDGTVRELLAVCKHYSLETRVRSSWTTVGGLGAVAAPPEHRREGHVRELCRHTLESYRADGVPLVVLWPFSTSFYGRMGWGTAHDVCRVELPPEALPSHDTVGRFRRLDADDWQRLRGVEADDRTAATLALRRSEAWWRERTLADWAGGGVPYCYGYERSVRVNELVGETSDELARETSDELARETSDDRLCGYLVYTVADDESHTLSVSHLVAVDEEAYRALLDFLGVHGAQVERVTFQRPVGTPILRRLDRPEEATLSVEPGPMVRLTGVTALDDVDWFDAAGESATPTTDTAGGDSTPSTLDCTLAVSDPLLDAGNGLFRLRTEGGRLAVDRVGDDSGRASDSAGVGRETDSAGVGRETDSVSDGRASVGDASIDIQTLSQLAVGATDVDTARRVGGLDLHDESVRGPLAAVFDAERVFLREFF